MTREGLRSLGRTLCAAIAHPVTLLLVPLVILLSDGPNRRLLVATLTICLVVAVCRQFFLSGQIKPRHALPDEVAFDAYLSKLLCAGGRARSACLLLRPNGSDCGTGERRTYSDDTIARLAEQIRPVLREDDFVARIQGDTLAVALSNRTALSVESVIQVALRLQRRADMPADNGAPVVAEGVRVGLALSVVGDCAEQLRARAGRALDEAGHNAIRCEASNNTPDRGALAVALARDLPAAFQTGEMIAHFQPQICLDTGKLTGVEALARWQHPEHGLLPPGQFLGICEAADLMSDLSEAMVRNAIAALAEWDRAGLEVPRVSVNFTLRDLSDPNLIDRLRWLLDAADLKPQRLGIEVLESVLCVDGDRAVSQTLTELRDMGCFIDLDDFGTGSASITNIRRFAIQRLKIDRSFVSGIDHDVEQRNMVAAILTMAEQLEIDTLAEGIETPEEFAMLAQLGCNHVQGFGIGRPMPSAQFPKWMAEREAEEMPQHLPEILRRAQPDPRPADPGQEAAGGQDRPQPNRTRSAYRSKGRGGKTA